MDVSEPLNEHRTIHVFGRVQGVFYRQSAKQQAMNLGLVGYARNEPDGSVQIEVEGEKAAIERFVAWCRVGPPAARVERVESAEDKVIGYKGFETS
jgi:acylphosphatase